MTRKQEVVEQSKNFSFWLCRNHLICRVHFDELNELYKLYRLGNIAKLVIAVPRHGNLVFVYKTEIARSSRAMTVEASLFFSLKVDFPKKEMYTFARRLCMTTAVLEKKVRSLPENLVAEVSDYIDFLLYKNSHAKNINGLDEAIAEFSRGEYDTYKTFEELEKAVDADA